MTDQNLQKSGKSSPWVIGILLGFLLVIGVNIAMVTLAIKSGRGEIETNSYEKGMAFQGTIDKRAFIKAEGISFDTTLRDQSNGERSEIYLVATKNGLPIERLEIKVELRRPADKAYDRDCAVSSVEPGHYSCSFDKLPVGLYLLTLLLGDYGRVDREIVLAR